VRVDIPLNVRDTLCWRYRHARPSGQGGGAISECESGSKKHIRGEADEGYVFILRSRSKTILITGMWSAPDSCRHDGRIN
jgi:hypothetical protein